jgi:2',3'-cyclic-nucleotide 2'-phosphodiesterase
MRILFFGDIVGDVGRLAVHDNLPSLVKKHQIDFVIANGENATHGKGLSEEHYKYLVDCGIDAITLGNHWHAKTQIDNYIDGAVKLVRPLNLIDYLHGEGSVAFSVKGVEIRVTNLLGQAFMNEEVGNTYDALTELLRGIKPSIHIVDFHAESTSEKEILAYLFDGKVSAVLGTHTHVQTADASILEKGTAYISDIGMCGASNGVIGFEKRSVIDKIVFGQSGLFEIDSHAPRMINAVILDIDETTFKTRKIEAISLFEEGK